MVLETYFDQNKPQQRQLYKEHMAQKQNKGRQREQNQRIFIHLNFQGYYN